MVDFGHLNAGPIGCIGPIYTPRARAWLDVTYILPVAEACGYLES